MFESLLLQTDPLVERAFPHPTVRTMRSYHEKFGHGHVSTNHMRVEQGMPPIMAIAHFNINVRTPITLAET